MSTSLWRVFGPTRGHEEVRAARWGDHPDITRTCRVPWEPGRDWDAMLHAVSARVRSMRDTDYTPAFSARALADLVFDINRLEGTISPALRDGSTLRNIHAFLAEGSQAPEPAEWNAEGGRNAGAHSSDRQLFQCAVAARYLLVEHRDAPLSCALIVETHKRLMQGAFDQSRDGRRSPVLVGRMRRYPDEEVRNYPNEIPTRTPSQERSAQRSWEGSGGGLALPRESTSEPRCALSYAGECWRLELHARIERGTMHVESRGRV